MAKRGTLTHRRTRRLAQAMGIELPFALGLMEALFHATADKAPRGDIGRLSDQDIADEMFWSGDAGRLVAALVESGVLDRDPACRLQVHGWGEHADDAVRKRLHRTGERFADGSPTWRRERAGDQCEAAPAESARPAGADQPAPGHVPPLAGHVRTCPANGGLPEPGQASSRPGQSQFPARPGRAGVGPAGDNAPAPARTPAPTDQADAAVKLEIEELAAEVAGLLGNGATPRGVLIEHSRTPRGKTFAAPDGGRPGWRRATLDRLRATAVELRAATAAASAIAGRRAEFDAVATDPPEARQRARNDWDMVKGRLRAMTQSIAGTEQPAFPEKVFADYLERTVGLRHRGNDLLVAVDDEGNAHWLRERSLLVEQAVHEVGLTCRVSYLANLRVAG